MSDWTAHGGGLPPGDEMPGEWMQQDIAQWRRPGVTLDVGWYPCLDPSGSFHCVVVRDDEWLEPAELFETRSLADVRAWVDRKLKEHAG